MTARNPASGEGGTTLSLPARLIRDASPRDQGVSQTQLRLWWRAMEQTITLGILLLIAWSVADSIWAAGWVDDMPDLRVVALLALVSAGVMASARVHWTVGIATGLAVGVVVVLWQVLTVDAVSGQPLFWDRFTDLWVRLEDWFRQAFNSGITTDNLPFVLFVTATVWLATFPGAFLVLRRRNPWPLLLFLGIILAVNVSYLRGKQWDFNFAVFTVGAALLIMRTTLLGRMEGWRRQGTPFPDFISLSFLVVTFAGIVLLLGVSWATPRPDRSAAVSSFWDDVTSPFDSLSDEFRRLFSGIDSQSGSPVHSFEDTFVLQGDISPGERIVARVDSPESGLLRGASYDRYTTRGWQQTDLDASTVSGGETIGVSSGAGLDTYADRREVTTRVSVEQSPDVLFTFGSPIVVDRDVVVEQTAPAEVRLDLKNPGEGVTSPELATAAREIAREFEFDRRLSSETTALIPDEFRIVGAPTSLDEDGVRQLDEFVLESAPADPDVVSIRATERVRAGFTYEVSGSVSDASVEALRSADSAYPVWVQESFLQLPSDLSDADLQRLQDLATQVTGGAGSAYDAAAALEAYLCCSAFIDDAGAPLLDDDGAPRLLYPFTTQTTLPPVGVDAVSWWLFDNVDANGSPLGGYYDYYASSLAVLLRVSGIPARVSTGFVLTSENFDERTRTFIVRGQHSYTWVEVYFPEFGWVDFDPTPEDTSGSLAGIAGQRIAQQRFVPFASDIFSDGQADFTDPLAESGGVDAFADIDFGLGQESNGFSLWFVVAPIIGLASVGMVAASGLAAWRLSLRGLTPVERAWAATQRLSRWGGLPLDPSETPTEYASMVGAAVYDGDSAQTLATLYARERFGRKTLSDPELDAVEGAWRRLRGRLVRRLLHLRVRAPDEVAIAKGSVDAGGSVDASVK